MPSLYQILLILHFLGLALGFSSSFGNAVMSVLIARAEQGLILGGDAGAMVRIQTVGKVAMTFAVVALVFAVLAFA